MLQEEWKIVSDGTIHILPMAAGYQAVSTLLCLVDINTQQSYEQLNKKSIAVVIDPIQSVRGKVVIDAFRLIPQ